VPVSKGSAELELTGTALRVIAGPRGEGEAFWFHKRTAEETADAY
jgi:hypothetical protein